MAAAVIFGPDSNLAILPRGPTRYLTCEPPTSMTRTRSRSAAWTAPCRLPGLLALLDLLDLLRMPGLSPAASPLAIAGCLQWGAFASQPCQVLAVGTPHRAQG